MTRVRYQRLTIRKTVAVFAFLISGYATAVPLDESILGKSATTDAVKRAESAKGSSSVSDIALGVRRRLQRAFEVPICIEWPYVNADRTTPDQPQLDFSIEANSPFRSNLDRFSESTDGKLVWEFANGALIIRAPSEAKDTENNLDTIVSLDLSGVSTWHALMALVKVINADPIAGRPIGVSPVFNASGKAGPDRFRNDFSVVLNLENVTAREALCAIIAASPFEMTYSYWLYYRPEMFPDFKPVSHLSIELFLEGKPHPLREGISREQMMLYYEDSKEMRGEE